MDEWVELTNGCLCCSVKDDFVNALESLMLQQTPFDYILVETTGLADPGPVASALWTDDELEAGAYVRAMWRAQQLLCAEQRMRLASGCGGLGACASLFFLSLHRRVLAGVVLDGIVTVVDAKHIRRQLQGQELSGTNGVRESTTAQHSGDAAGPGGEQDSAGGPSNREQPRRASVHGPALEAQRQVAYADTILLNKVDLVDEAALADIERAIRRHNAAVQVRT